MTFAGVLAVVVQMTEVKGVAFVYFSDLFVVSASGFFQAGLGLFDSLCPFLPVSSGLRWENRVSFKASVEHRG